MDRRFGARSLLGLGALRAEESCHVSRPRHRIQWRESALKEAVHRFSAEVLRPAAAALDRVSDPEAVIALAYASFKTTRP